jgi:hypothetical protein
VSREVVYDPAMDNSTDSAEPLAGLRQLLRLLLRGRSAVKGSPDPIGRAPCRGPLTIPDVLTMETLADVGRH